MSGVEELQVSRRVEEALFFKLKAKAFKTCKASADAYAQCCQGRSVSMVWACRKELNTMSACLGEHTNKEVMSTLKKRWVDAGQPHQHADWTELLKDL